MAAYQACRCLLRGVGGSTMAATRTLSTTTSTTSTPAAGTGKLAGKVAIITGSTEGIGYSIAKRLGEDGASVILSSRRQENVDRAVGELKDLGLSVCGTTCHVANAEDREKLLQKTLDEFGGIDIFISNAAVNPITNGLINCPDSVWDKVMDVNIKSPFILTKMIIPHMKARKGGNILYIASNAAYSAPFELGAYCVSKTATLSMMKVFSQELAVDNIRVNCLAPGPTRTTFGTRLSTDRGMHNKIMSLSPMQRIAEPDEYGGAASFMVSDDASYMTGETLVITGGMNTRL